MSRQRTGYDRDNRNSDSGRYGRTHRGENYGNYGGRSQEDDYDDNGHRYRQDDYEDDYDDNRGGRGRQGFASMDPGRQRAIAAKGGRHSHDNDDYNDNGRRYRNRQDDYDYEDDYDDNRGGHGRQGFASMDPGRQRAIAAKGGRHSHDNDDRRYDDEDDYDYYDEYDDRDYDDDYDEDENEGEDNRRSGRGYRQSGGSRGHQSRNPDGTFASTSRSGRRRGSGGDTSKRGFASMNKSEVRRIAAMGGRASHGGHSGSRSSRRGW